MNRFPFGFLAVCAIVGLLSLGCGEADPGVPVSGTVTMGGQGQGGVRAYFIPSSTDASGPKFYGAITDTSGKFQAKVPPGKYSVMLSKKVDKSGNVPSDSEDPELDYTQLEASGMLREAMPQQYTSPTSTPISVEIPPEGKDLEPFEVTM